MGILASGAVKSRARLPTEKYLEFIFEPNAVLRKDQAWLDYVNCSMSAINSKFFDVCANCWHRGEDLFWLVLGFDPVIATHDDVRFTTTNNMYSGVSRRMGADGFEAMFADRITQWVGHDVIRSLLLGTEHPTDEQAEVLYPGEVSTEYLRTVYTPTEHAFDVVGAHLAVFPHPNVDVVLDPSLRRRMGGL